jgi:uncharacterized protein YjbI with pentapeptide repeats
MQIEIRNRWTAKVQFTAEIECSDDASVSLKIGRAVKWAYKIGADLCGTDLSHADLSYAILPGIHLSRAALCHTNLSHADLSHADLLGANLSHTDLSHANLSYADLSHTDLSPTNLRDANLSHADLRDANLSSSTDLSHADLRGAALSCADLSRVLPPEEIPVISNIDAAILAAIEAGGKLKMAAWHTCKTTHSRAGWAIALAGKVGADLEQKVGSFHAGCLIYAASRPGKAAPHFFASDEAAMADIRTCAAEYLGGQGNG